MARLLAVKAGALEDNGTEVDCHLPDSPVDFGKAEAVATYIVVEWLPKNVPQFGDIPYDDKLQLAKCAVQAALNVL